MSLRLAILNTWGGACGGAARAVYRLHTELRRQGVESTLLAADEIPENDPSVVCLRKPGYRLARWATKWLLRDSPKPWPDLSLNRFSTVRAHAHPATRRADVVMLGWLGANFMSPAALGRLRRPLLWRLSDIWPFSGGCHYPGRCARFESQCGKCPLLAQAHEDDATRWQWTTKSRAYGRLDLTIAAPSRWIADAAKRSSLLGDRPIHLLPSGVDTERFKPADQRASRRALDLPRDARVLMFGAVNSTRNARKGYAQLQDTIRLLAASPEGRDLRLVVFGNQRPIAPDEFPLPVHALGRLDTDAELARLYPAADLFVAPSLEENLPNTVMEAMACGIPGVAFATGGMPDLIVEGQTGALAPALDAASLAEAIARALNRAAPIDPGTVRRHILEHYDLRRQTLAYRKVLEALRSPASDEP